MIYLVQRFKNIIHTYCNLSHLNTKEGPSVPNGGCIEGVGVMFCSCDTDSACDPTLEEDQETIAQYSPLYQQA